MKLVTRVPNEESRYVIASCAYCSHEWEISQRALDSRLARWGIVRCPHCGAELKG